MFKEYSKCLWVAVAAMLLPLAVTGCGGTSNSSTSSGNGTVDVALTDAPNTDFDHVWITVKSIWFHKVDTADSSDPAWLKYPLAPSVSIDLAHLNNGQMNKVFQGLSLPEGTYQQIRLFLAPTESVLTSSASAAGLTYNNQVVYTSGATQVTAPLRVFSAFAGIRVVGSFSVSSNKPLHLVIDFDIGHDVVAHGTQFLLKPRLNYFDLDNAGAIAGKLDTSNFCTTSTTACGYNFVIKAERLSADGTRHVVARATTVKPDGSFVLYPLPVPANAASKNYDIVLRGRNVETYIIRGVPANRGTTLDNPTQIQTSPIAMTLGSEYTANFSAAANPTGAWMNFYATLDPAVTGNASEVPYEIRYRHLNPYTGVFAAPIALSMSPLRFGAYNGGADITAVSVIPQEGLGNYKAVADALLYDPRVTGMVNAPSTAGSNVAMPNFTLSISAPAVAASVSGTIITTNANLDTGYLVISRGGVVVTTVNVSSLVGTGGTYKVQLPGGSASTFVPGAFYTMQLLAWDSNDATQHALALSPVIDLRAGDASGIDLTLSAF